MNDLWVFANWFYVGCKKQAKKDSSNEEKEKRDFNVLDMHDGRFTTLLPATKR